MTDGGRFTLYGETLWGSPYVFSSYVALTEKGVPFDVIEVPLAEECAQVKAPYRDISITARVPTLEHDGFSLAESSAIAEYLEEVLPAPAYRRLFPEDARARARARQIMAWLRSDLVALRDERSTVTMFHRFRLEPPSKACARDIEKLLRVADQMIPANGGHLFGEWALVDSELAFMLHRLMLTGEDIPARIRGWATEQWQRPSVREFIQHPRPAKVPDTYWGFSGTPRPEPA
jgi:glutathione S-transferase